MPTEVLKGIAREEEVVICTFVLAELVKWGWEDSNRGVTP